MKVAIVGAGIAGPTLAYWLTHHGHETTVIEKSPHLRTGGYVVDFWGGGYTVAQRMGLDEELQAKGYAVNELRLVDGRGKRVGGFGVEAFRRNLAGRFVSVSRGDLAAMIYHLVQDRVETLFGQSISAIEQDDGEVAVTLGDGVSRTFDLVVGAGGIHSPVRGMIFGPNTRFDRDLGYRVAAFETTGYRPREELVYVAYSTPGRMVGRFTLRDDRTLFLFVYRDGGSGDDPADAAQTRSVLRSRFADAGWECPQILDSLEEADDLYFDRVSQIVIDRWSRGRVALVGDAAAAVSLLAGEGAGLAMVAAYILAGELARAGDDYAEGFRRYEDRLRPVIADRQQSARRFASVFAPRTALGVWTRNHASSLLNMKSLADWTIRREFAEDVALPAYQ